MKKICILSMQRVNNFGSLLQSYSLKKILESLDNKVEFIDIKKMDEDNKLLSKKIVSKEEKEAKKSKLSKIDKYALNKIFIKLKDNKQNKEFEKFRKEYLNISEENNNKKYDICVIGSDEVFNCATTSSWGFTSQLFGNVENSNSVITYAASCGATKFENLSNSAIDKIKESFKNIKAFSVRDANTYEFVSKMTNKEININLDPVLVGNFDKEIRENSNIKLPKKFCIVYSYYNRFNSKEEINEIKKLCKLNNMEIITIGAPQYWIKNHIVMNPFQVLYAFSKADFIITDTFHGTIFASKYSKKFATIIRDSNNNKLSDLIDRLNLNGHLCKDISKLSDVYKCENNLENVDNICKNAQKKSINYLKENINE